jgi:uncharacterized membrane protein (UPF0127 family)
MMMPAMQANIGRKKSARGVIALAIAALLAPVGCTAETQPKVTLSINEVPIQVEIAHSEETRSRGLSHREVLANDSGMLFIFREPALHALWMLNTRIPLSVAFVDKQGSIINIATMGPHTLTRHLPDRPAKYALEVNRGWFAAHGITPGMQVAGIEHAPPAE